VSNDGTAVAWDVAGSRSLVRTFTFTHDRDFDGAYDRLPGRFSPDGRLVAVGLKEQGVALLDAESLSPAGPPLLDTGGEVKAVSFAPDGRTLAAMTAYGQVTVWDLESRTVRYRPARSSGADVGLGFSPDGRTLATTGSWDGVELWDAATGARRGQVRAGGGAGTSDVAFGDGGRLIASARPGSGTPGAVVWDLERGAPVLRAEGVGSGDSVAVALSPDGGLLAVGGYGNVVSIWDVDSGKLRRTIDLGGAGALALDFSGDGRILAISGFEPVASLWDVETGIRIGPALTAGLRAAMVDLSPDGKRLLMTAANGEGAVWDVDPASWARRACEVANRSLTRAEWEAYLPGRPYDPACR
jgi:WD40 repeat protein